MENITIEYLQKYIKAKDHSPEDKEKYFLKLAEEVGELSRAMRKNLTKSDCVKDTIDEEVWDVIYYAIALANCYDINLSETITQKERMNKEKYNHQITFGEAL